MGLFSKSKDKSEQKDATDIKQATISDSQKNSIQSNPAQVAQSEPAQSNPANQQMSNENFVNPFSNQGSSQSGSVQNPFDAQSAGNTGASQVKNPFDSQGVTGQNPTGALQQQPQQAADPMTSIAAMQPAQSNAVDFDKIQEMIDETVEKIIEEKWNTLEDKVNKVLRWKETKDAEINMLKEDLVSLADGFNKLEMKLINKISNYDKNIMDVNSEIKALEKVFQKVTPTLINNVNELSKIADEFKGVEPKKRKVMTEDDFKVEAEPERETSNNNSKSVK